MTVISHTTPKISPFDAGGSSPYVRSVPVGNDPGWIIVETASGGAGFVAGEDPPEDDGSPKWGYGAGAFLFYSALIFRIRHSLSMGRPSNHHCY